MSKNDVILTGLYKLLSIITVSGCLLYYLLNRPPAPEMNAEVIQVCQEACLYSLEIHNAQSIEVGMMEKVTVSSCECNSNRYNAKWFNFDSNLAGIPW